MAVVNCTSTTAVALSVFAGVVTSASGQSVATRPVATTVDEVEGAVSGTAYSQFSPTMLVDGMDRVFFSSWLSGPAGASGQGVWLEEGEGGLGNVFLTGSQAPGMDPGVFIAEAHARSFTPGGDSILRTTLAGPGIDASNDGAIWYLQDGGVPQLVAQTGVTVLPGGLVPSGFYSSAVREQAGELVLQSYVTGPGVSAVNDALTWRLDSTGVISIDSRKGDPAPMFGADAVNTWTYEMPTGPDDLYEYVKVSGPDITFVNDAGIVLFHADGSPGTVAVRKGDPVPGLAGYVFGDISDFDTAGESALFFARLNNTSDGTSTTSLWHLSTEHGLNKIGVSGDPAVGGTASETFIFHDSIFYRTARIAPDGAAAFTANLGSQSNDGLWTYHPDDGIAMVARTGDEVPGMPGFEFDEVGPEPVVNSSGQVLFEATTRDTAGSSPDGQGIWASSPGYNRVVPVMVSGQSKNVRTTGTPIYRTITLARLDSNYGYNNHESTMFSDSGAFVFHIKFSGGGSGIFAGQIFALADCPADVNADGMLTPTDFTAWINAFNNNLPECDQNGDGSCTPTDFTAWIANFNAGC